MARRRQETSEEREERRAERWEGERNSGGLVPVAASRKNSPHRSETWPIMCARERAFLRGGPRLAEGGRRRHVDESRAAGKPRAISLDSARDFEKKGARDEKERERERSDAGNARVLSAISIYFASNLHVSPRVSALFRAQHSCDTPSTSLLSFVLLVSSFSARLPSSFLRVRRRERRPRNKLVILSSPPHITLQRRSRPSRPTEYTPASLCSPPEGSGREVISPESGYGKLRAPGSDSRSTIHDPSTLRVTLRAR